MKAFNLESNKYTPLVSWTEVGSFDIKLKRVPERPEVSVSFGHANGSSGLADVHLVASQVLEDGLVTGGVEVGLQVVALLEDVIALRPTLALPAFCE